MWTTKPNQHVRCRKVESMNEADGERVNTSNSNLRCCCQCSSFPCRWESKLDQDRSTSFSLLTSNSLQAPFSLEIGKDLEYKAIDLSVLVTAHVGLNSLCFIPWPQFLLAPRSPEPSSSLHHSAFKPLNQPATFQRMTPMSHRSALALDVWINHSS